MEKNDSVGAIQSFGRARAQMRHYGGQPLFVVSLVNFLMGVLQPIEFAHHRVDIWLEV